MNRCVQRITSSTAAATTTKTTTTTTITRKAASSRTITTAVTKTIPPVIKPPCIDWSKKRRYLSAASSSSPLSWPIQDGKWADRTSNNNDCRRALTTTTSTKKVTLDDDHDHRNHIHESNSSSSRFLSSQSANRETQSSTTTEPESVVAPAEAAAAPPRLWSGPQPMKPYPRGGAKKVVPGHIPRPPYAGTGVVPAVNMHLIYRHGKESITRMRKAAQLARRALDLACSVVEPGMTTDDVDTIVHSAIIEAGAYPSPLNYAGFPKSLCASVNEVVCHGIPDTRPLQFGDVVSFDVSCFFNGVHGDNCATVIVGDELEGFDKSTAVAVNDRAWPSTNDRDWRGIPYRTANLHPDDEQHLQSVRKLSQVARESLYAAIDVCRPGSCLTEIGAVIEDIATANGYASVQKYRGHGIAHDFHCPPFVKHFRNRDYLTLEPGMIFTIEPMLAMGQQDTFEWPQDNWTVVTQDGSLAAQFEHTILITEDSYEILTLP